jgi:hypothetical protein
LERWFRKGSENAQKKLIPRAMGAKAYPNSDHIPAKDLQVILLRHSYVLKDIKYKRGD